MMLYVRIKDINSALVGHFIARVFTDQGLTDVTSQDDSEWFQHRPVDYQDLVPRLAQSRGFPDKFCLPFRVRFQHLLPCLLWWFFQLIYGASSTLKYELSFNGCNSVKVAQISMYWNNKNPWTGSFAKSLSICPHTLRLKYCICYTGYETNLLYSYEAKTNPLSWHSIECIKRHKLKTLVWIQLTVDLRKIIYPNIE